MLRGASYGSPMARFQDEMAGVGYYKFIEDLEKNFQDKKDEIVAGLENAMAEIIRRDSFMVSYTGERESVEQLKTLSGCSEEEPDGEHLSGSGGCHYLREKERGI